MAEHSDEWVDAEKWLDMIERGPAGQMIDREGRPWKPMRPLNFVDGQKLAYICGFQYRYQSDGTTLLKVGKRRARQCLRQGDEGG